MIKGLLPSLVLAILIGAQATASPQGKEMLVRISEIEVVPGKLEEYKAIGIEVAEASVRLEKGVISIFPMFQKENPNQVRILEIYADRDAYESHIKSPHFQKYKTTSLKLVKSLRLMDMDALDPEAMGDIFIKMEKAKK